MTYYIVQRVGYEYNDEVNSRGESEGGTPEKVFQSKEAAIAHCDVLNAKELSGLNLMEYGYSTDKVCRNFEKLSEILVEFGQDAPSEDNYKLILPKLTVEQYKKIKPYILVSLYEVVKCDGE